MNVPDRFTFVPDAFEMLAVVLQILFEISVWVAWYWERRDRKRALQAGDSA